ncbi:MAG TPA: NrfD/PsrC family molybdoenzyme membrane anchor subunit [Anaerolineales bacterium]|nr:NrfD/PsrC family molybdoenzyme membrane anchor subunit [Anaerolineales bacterium]
MTKKVLYALGGLALLVGLWGFYDRFVNGHQNMAYGSYVVWGLWVAMYLFFVGISAGAFMLATLDYLFEIPLFKGTGKAALWGALVTLPAGLVSIGLDLGHLERIWKVYLQPNPLSVMAQMVWGYTIFGLIALVALVLAIRQPKHAAMKILMIVGLFLAVFLSGGVGALLGVNAGRTYWHVGLLPAQFPVFSLASGAALMLVIIGLFGPAPAGDPSALPVVAGQAERRSQQLWVLGLLTVVLGLVKVYFLWADFSQSLYGGIPQNVQAVNEVMFGRYWWAFWILQIGLGTIIPVIVLVQPKLAKHNGWAGWMGVLVLTGFAVARANIVFPALTVPELEALRTAFTGPHLSYDYFPSLVEWAVTLGIIGGATLVFLLGTDRLPIFTAKTEVTK